MHRKIALVSALMVGASALTACSLASSNVKVRPVDISNLTMAPYDRFYEGAASAIKDRNYALALDYLQEARAREPRSIKVLNALGVVYDKLGRFDLSARYYRQAREIEPGARIVADNYGYSQVLQGFMKPAPATVAAVVKPVAVSKASSYESRTMVASAVVDPARIRTESIARMPAVANSTVAKPSQPVEKQMKAAKISPASLATPGVVKVTAVLPAAEKHVKAAKISPTFSSVKAFAKLLPASLAASAPMKFTAALPTKVATPSTPAPIEVAAALRARMSSPPARPSVVKPVQSAALVHTIKARIIVIGQPLQILNASGRADRIGVVAQRLKMLGWTVRPSDMHQARTETVLFHSPANLRAAQALQRTLPFPVRLTRGDSGSGMQLVIGKDYLSWKPRNARFATLWQKGTVVASLQKSSTRGVR